MRIVEVEWIDTVGTAGWRPVEEVIHGADVEGTYHRSVGYLIEQTEAHVLIAQSHGDNSNMVADTLQFPIAAVRGVYDLRRK